MSDSETAMEREGEREGKRKKETERKAGEVRGRENNREIENTFVSCDYKRSTVTISSFVNVRPVNQQNLYCLLTWIL